MFNISIRKVEVLEDNSSRIRDSYIRGVTTLLPEMCAQRGIRSIM